MHFQQSDSILDAAAFLEQFDQFSLMLHRSLRLNEVMGVAVNDGRTLVGVDRLSLGIRAGKKCLIKAISGQDKVVLRSGVVRRLEQLGASVLATGAPLRYDGQLVDAVSEDTLADYVTESQARSILILPLRVNAFSLAELAPTDRRSANKEEIVGCLVVEQFSDSVPGPELEKRTSLIADHVACAVHNARTHHAIFLLPLFCAIGHALRWFEGKKLWAALAILSSVAVFVIACFAVPWQYRVSAKGMLMPKDRRDIFAPWDGDVMEIYVKDGQAVHVGDKLLRLKSDELRTQHVAALTEADEKRKLIASLEKQLDDARRSADEQTQIRLQGELARAEIEWQGATTQVTVLDRRLQQLLLTAPLNGIVATFQIEQRLADRPVKRGEELLQVVNPTTDWQLELEVPEHRVGHVLGALKAAEAPRVDFVLATSVEQRLHGELLSVGTRVDESEDVGAAVQAVVKLSSEAQSLQDRHVGAEVHAKIHCGKRSLGYVLFGDVLEFLAKRLWL